jgi:hypothetical protein
MFFPAPTHDGRDLPALINKATMSQLTGFAPRTLRRFKQTGRIPSPNAFGMWQRDEVLCWIENGMPNAAVWEATRPKRFRAERPDKIADRKF